MSSSSSSFSSSTLSPAAAAPEIGASLFDLAIGKPAEASSLLEKYCPSGATGVLTGKPAERFGFHTLCEENPWWKVDLLTEYPLYRIVVRNRVNIAQERANSLRVEVSTDDKTWSVLHSGPFSFGDGRKLPPLTIDLKGLVKARFVRLSLVGKEYLHLSQVEVFSRLEAIEEAERNLPVPLRGKSLPKENAARVVILGTSNSIMGSGYTSVLHTPSLAIAANISLGSSHAPMLAYRLLQMEKQDFDILIIDLAVNEQRAYFRDLYNLETSEDIFVYLLTWCARKNVAPVILIMPDQRSLKEALKDPQAGKIREHYRKLCFKYQIPVFDGHEFIETLAQTWKRTTCSFFMDDNHLSRFSAQILGTFLENALVNQVHSHQASNQEIASSDFTYLPLADKLPEADLIERKTSIATERFIRLKPGSSFHVAVPKHCEVVGVSLNMSQSNASLILKGATILEKRLDNQYFAPDQRPLWLVVWTVLNPLWVTDGALELSCLPVRKEAEMNDHSAGRAVSYDLHEPVVEVAGLVLRLPKESRQAVTFPGMELDLVKFCPLEKLPTLLSQPVSE